MGNYINPTKGEKEQWLAEHGTHISYEDLCKADFDTLKAKDKVALVLVDNMMFTALLVCDTKFELEYMQKCLATEDRPYRCYTSDWDEAQKEIR